MNEVSSSNEVKDLISLLWRRKWIVILTTVVTISAAWLVDNSRTETYQASARVLVPSGGVVVADNTGAPESRDADRRLANEMEFLRRDAIRAAVAERLGSFPPISAAPDARADVLVITGRAVTRLRAAEIANVYAEEYVRARLDATIGQNVSASTVLREELGTLERERADLTAPVSFLDQAILAEPDPDIVNDLVARRALEAEEIRADLVRLDARIDSLTASLDDLGIAQRLAESASPTITADARPPRSPVSPNILRDLVLAAAAGLVLGCALAVMADLLDESVKSEADLQQLGLGVPLLASIPWSGSRPPDLVMNDPDRTAEAEAYRTLRTSLLFSSVDRPVHSLLVTSANAAEGKSRVASNLALALTLTQAERPVVAIDADWRRPKLHEVFGVDKNPGFSDVVLGQTTLADALTNPPAHRKLVLLSAGTTPPNPAEVLASDRAAEVFTSFDDRVDWLVVDSAPVLPVADTLTIAQKVDLVVVVVRSGVTSRKAVKHAIDQLEQRGATVAGFVLNGVRAADLYGRGRHDYHYFSPPKRRWRKRKQADTPTEQEVAEPIST